MSARRVRIFKNGRDQVIRIPRELELPTCEATIHREGNRLVIEPLERVSLPAMLASWEPLDLDFPEIANGVSDAVDL